MLEGANVKISLNGTFVEQPKNITLFEVKKTLNFQADVVILNGFQTDEDFILQEDDIVTILKKGVMPKIEELESMMLARHTPFVHNAVKKATVGIAGLGGLGSNIAIMLARTGVGHIILVDFDVVEPSNLNRQNYYCRHIGMLKTKAMEEQLKEINPFVHIEVINKKVEETNVAEIFQNCAFVCEAFDHPHAKAVLVNGLLEQVPNIKIVASSGMAGYASSNEIVTSKKFKNLYVCGDMKREAEVGNGLMAPRVSICAGHQANMILRLILGMETV